MMRSRVIAVLLFSFQGWLAWNATSDALAVAIAAFATFVVMTKAIRGAWPLMISAPLLVGMGAISGIWHFASPTPAASSEVVWWLSMIADVCLLAQLLTLLTASSAERRTFSVAALGLVVLITIFSQASQLPLATLSTSAAVAVALVAAVCQFPLDFSDNHQSSSRDHWPMFIALIGLVMIVAWQIQAGWIQIAPYAQTWFSSSVAKAAGSEGPFRVFGRYASLTNVTQQKLWQPNAEAVRVTSTFIPGYLRGAAFDTLEGSQWHQARTRNLDRQQLRAVLARLEPSPFPSGQMPLAAGYNFFQLGDSLPETPYELMIEVNSTRAGISFTPLDATALQGFGRQLYVDEHRVIRRGVDLNHAYTTYVPRRPEHQELPVAERAALLTIPSTLDSRVHTLAHQVLGEATSTTQKISRVEEFFRSKFSYSLEGFAVPAETDSLSHFLLHRPSAHCEYFASGATLLLRSQGVPCRYVMGYVVTAQDRKGEVWLGRNRDAHAWCEAYDEQLKRWVIVEATPGVTAPKHPSDAEGQNETGTNISANGALDTGSQVAGWWVKGWANLDLAILSQIISGSAVIGALAWYVAQQRRYRARSSSDPHREEIAALLVRMNRRASRFKFVRRNSETLHQFAARLRLAAADQPELEHLADWYLLYANVSYGPNLNEELVRELKTATTASPEFNLGVVGRSGAPSYARTRNFRCDKAYSLHKKETRNER